MTRSLTSLGLFFSVGALVQWSLAPFFFTLVGRRIGPVATNLNRLLLATGILALLSWMEFHWWAPGLPLPGRHAFWLFAISGVVGLALGDHFFYSSLYEIGPERTSLLMTLAPAATVAIAWIFLKEKLSPLQITGTLLVLGGIALATWPNPKAKPDPNSNSNSDLSSPTPGSIPRSVWKDAWNGIAAALCQGTGTVLARQAFLDEPNLSPLFATTTRVGAGAIAMAAYALSLGTLGSSMRGARNPTTAKWLLAGTIVGPVGGMLFYVSALKHQSAGIVTTITFMTPLIILPLGAWWFKTRLSARVLAGGAVALAGVVFLGW